MKTTTKLIVEERPIEWLKPYDKNPRKNDAGVDEVAQSIVSYGFRQPIVTDEHGVIIVGHTRYKAALKLGLKTVPVHIARGLSEAQIKAYRIADNQTATLSGWDFDLLPLELAELKTMGFDLELTSFSPAEIERLLNAGSNPGLVDPDDIPEPPAEAVTQPGDLWILGNHRLLCGDSSKPEDVDRLLDGAKIHLVNTDPPYGINLEPRSNNARAAGSKALPAIAKTKAHLQGFDDARQGKPKATHKQMRAKDRPLANDFLAGADFDKILLAWFGNIARVLLPGRCFYIWGGYANWANYCSALAECGLYFAQGITWVKGHPVLGRKDFMNDCEHAWYGWREGAGHQFFGPNNASNVWPIKKVTPQAMIHLTEKPVELAARAIVYSSQPGENVLDLFGGSGSTLIACEQQGRRAFLMELDPLYADTICDRYQRFTGKPAVLQRTGKSPIPMTPREEHVR